MSDEIVRKLLETKRSILRFDEAGDDEKDPLDIDDSEDEEEDSPSPEEDMEDDAHAPEQGHPTLSHSHSTYTSDDPDIDTEDEPEDKTPDDDIESEYTNPLDNPYAVQHTISDDVVMVYSDGTNSELHGVIDGYDVEGFYRVQWENGLTTNGLTDIALADFISKKTESKCICGSKEFINEGKYIVCDRCGRHIRENKTLDVLTIADKSRPKSKRMIRSEAHPMSTSVKPSISETIRDIFKKSNTLNEEEDYEDEDYEEEEDSDVFALLKSKLDREFWTRLPELKEDIEDLGYIVEDINAEYVVVASSDDDIEYSLYIPIGGTSRTMTLDFDRSREIR